MKKLSILLVASLLFISCNSNNETLEGELYFKLVEFLPSKGLTQEQSTKISDEIDKNRGSNDVDKAKLYDYLSKLKSENLLDLPHINLKLKSGAVIQVFLKNEDYLKLNSFTLDSLNAKGNKVLVKINLKEIDKEIYLANEIIDVQEIKGKAPWSK